MPYDIHPHVRLMVSISTVSSWTMRTGSSIGVIWIGHLHHMHSSGFQPASFTLRNREMDLPSLWITVKVRKDVGSKCVYIKLYILTAALEEDREALLAKECFSSGIRHAASLRKSLETISSTSAMPLFKMIQLLFQEHSLIQLTSHAHCVLSFAMWRVMQKRDIRSTTKKTKHHCSGEVPSRLHENNLNKHWHVQEISFVLCCLKDAKGCWLATEFLDPPQGPKKQAPQPTP